GRNVQSLLGCMANGAASDAVAPAFEGGSRDEQLGLETRHLAKQLLRRFFQMFGEVVVAAKAGSDDFALLPQRLLEGTTRSDVPFFEAGAYVGFFFSADLCEKLVQVMNDANFFAHVDLLSISPNQPV